MYGVGYAITKAGLIRTIRNADISGCDESSWLQIDSVPDVEDKYLNRDVNGLPVAMTAGEQATKNTELLDADKAQILNLNDTTGEALLRRTDYTQSCPDALAHGRVTETGRAAYDTWRQDVYTKMQLNTAVDWDTVLASEPSPH